MKDLITRLREHGSKTEVEAADEIEQLRGTLNQIARRAESDATCEELEDAQRDLRHIHAMATTAVSKAKTVTIISD